jgi:hypothetical protein
MVGATDEADVQNGTLTVHLRRKEQDVLDRIIHGDETGHYFMILGCKVTLSLIPTLLIDAHSHTGNWKDNHDTGCHES